MTITPLTLDGTLRAMGRQYGEARSRELAQAMDAYFNMFALLPGAPNKELLLACSEKLLPPAQAASPEDLDFIRGQAEGAGLPFDEFFCMQSFLEVMFNYHVLPGLCTSFAVTGPATKGGRTIVGQNVDWFTYCPVDLLRMEHTNGMNELVLCLLGLCAYHLTSHGLCNSTNLTLGPPMKVPSAPLAVYLPKALREPTLERAMAVLEAEGQGLIYHHVVDDKGAMLGLESIPERHVRMEPQEGVLVHANSYEVEEFKPLDNIGIIMADSPKRSARLHALVAERHGELDVEIMQGFLRDHDGHPTSICRHPEPQAPPSLASESRTSLVMLPKERVMWVSDGPPCENPYQEFQL